MEVLKMLRFSLGGTRMRTITNEYIRGQLGLSDLEAALERQVWDGLKMSRGGIVDILDTGC